MPRRGESFTLCTCSRCREKDPHGVGLVISAKEHAAHQAAERMGVPLLQDRVSYLTTTISDLTLEPRVPMHPHAPPPIHLSKAQVDVQAPLETAFSEMTIEDGNQPSYQPTDSNDKLKSAHRMTSLPMRPPGKKGRSTRGRTTVALKILRSIQNETTGLRAQVHDTPESEMSFEALVRVALRLETFGIALDKTNRSEPEVLSLKRRVVEEVDSLGRECDALRERMPRLTETGPVRFCSGEFQVKRLIFVSNGRNTDDHMKSSAAQLDVVAQIALLLGLVCAFVAGVSRRAGDFVFGMLNILLATIFRDKNTRFLDPITTAALQQVPKTLETAAGKFNLKGRLVFYAVCTACNKTHKPIFKPGHKHPVYPKYCNNIPEPGSPKCGTPLLERHSVGGLNIFRPILSFAYHEFKDFVCGFECRPDLRQYMDNSCDVAMESIRSGSPTNLNDAFDADFIRSFMWKDNKLFIDRPAGEARLLFSLFFDFFNVEESRQAGAKTSTGIIAMACLNLPVDIRYKPENMYIAGIIPGPKEPPGTQSNHFIAPLVDDLVEAWDRGICFSHSPDRVVRCALACAVCDLVGACKLSCMAGVTSDFICTICKCKGHKDYGRTDFEQWRKRDPDDLREAAVRWRDAVSVGDQNNIFAANGVRWSELWRLSYWDPTRQLVIDPMHCLLLGLAKRHFRHVLGLQASEAARTEKPPPPYTYAFPPLPDPLSHPSHPMFDKQSSQFLSENQYRDVKRLYQTLQEPLEDGVDSIEKRLFRKSLRSLEYVGRSLGLEPTEQEETRRRGKM